jgi:S-(hydroxymethyl)glutathione dehydrogenase/alcohol dehydrogenase
MSASGMSAQAGSAAGPLSVPGIVLAQLGHYPTLETVVVLPPGPDEVRVRVMGAGICHTDYGYVQYARTTPVLLGHEAAGVVEAIGPGVQHVRPGDHVVINWQAKCGRCPRCQSGRRDLCENILGTAEPRIYWRDAPLAVMLNAGAFCPYVVVPAGGAIPIRRDMPLLTAALLGCAVATGVGAALNTAAVRRGEDVAVFGVGGVGLNVVQGARLASAERIIAVDTDPAKLHLATQMGATHTINPNDTNLVEQVMAITGGRGVEYVFDCVGQPALMQQGIDLLARGGALVLIGAADREALLTFAPRRFMSMQQRIVGCIFGNIRPEVDFPNFADWYMDGWLQLDELHSQTITLAQIPEYFAHPELRQGIRTLVDLEHAL